jgi:SAM-dependent methyltransferase
MAISYHPLSATDIQHRRQISGETRSLERLRAHYEIERRLADRLRNSTRAERAQLYNQVYDELFRLVPDHSQHAKKVTTAARDKEIERQVSILSAFLKPGSVYLEVGCGDCQVAYAVARRVRYVYGVDVSTEITKRSDAPANFELVISDGTSIPASGVDVVYSNQLMEHLHADDAAEQLDNIARALKPGGTYVCMTPNRLTGPHDVSRYFDRIATGLHLHEYTYHEVQRLFHAAGFRRMRALLAAGGRRLQVPVWVVLSVEWFAERIPLLTRLPLVRRLLNIQLAATRGKSP